MPEIETAIANALLQLVEDLELTPAIPVAWPDKTFKPPNDWWIRPTIIPAETDSRGLANNSTDHYQGILQISILSPNGKGIKARSEIAGAIVRQFARGTMKTRDGVTVSVTHRPSIGQMLDDEDGTHIPVSIRYHAFIRPT